MGSAAGLRIAVAGGSLGGLTAALLLRDAGHDVHVYERSRAELEARGAGIVALDQTIRYVAERTELDVDAVSTSTPTVRTLDARGRVVHEERRAHRFSSWNAIYRALLGAFEAERYHLGAEVVGSEEVADGVTVRFADGATIDADLLVCADGIRSEARRRLLPQVERRYAGYVAWRGTVAESELSSATYERLHDALTYQLLDGSHILVYPIPSVAGGVAPGERLANVVYYRNTTEEQLTDLLTDRDGHRRDTAVPPGMVRAVHLDDLRSAAVAELAPAIAEVVMGAVEPFVQVIYDVAVPRMVFGRTVLLGDAAFAVRPHAAAGTAKACDDGWALAEVLSRDDDLGTALQRWETRQVAVGSALLARARAIGDGSQFGGGWVPGDPKLRFGLHGPGA
jgi:2,6-dihydroxypyridine 3-monooxygenase